MTDHTFRDPDPRVLLLNAVARLVNRHDLMESTMRVGEYFMVCAAAEKQAPVECVTVAARVSAILFLKAFENLRRNADHPEVAALGIHDDPHAYAVACMDMVHVIFHDILNQTPPEGTLQ